MKNKVLKRMFLNTLVLYPTLYLINCFVFWRFSNPFQWFLDIPTEDYAYRFFVFLGWIVYVLLNALNSAVYIAEKEKEEKEEK